MTIKYIQSMHEIVDLYDTFLLDQWGVLHNGGDMLPNAMSTLEMLYDKGKKVMILSNSGQPRSHTHSRLANNGVPRHWYHDVMTSGDHVRHAYAEGRFDNLGMNPYFMEPNPLFSEMGGRQLTHTPITQADYILCCTAFGGLDTYMDDILIGLDRGLELVCTNPDLYAKTADGRLHPCPGLVAHEYEKRGGKVHLFGKPYAEMYDLCKHLAGGWHKAIGVGDSFAHDIRGANTSHIDSIFITTGIHSDTCSTPQGIIQQSETYGDMPTYALDWF